MKEEFKNAIRDLVNDAIGIGAGRLDGDEMVEEDRPKVMAKLNALLNEDSQTLNETESET